jgi:Phage integrase family.
MRKPRYHITRAGRHYWSPSRELVADGWPTVRLDDHAQRAAAQAEACNAWLDAWRGSRVLVPSADALSAWARAGQAADALTDWVLGHPDTAGAKARKRSRAGTAPASAVTVAALVRRYMRSAEWRELARKTQRAYEQNLAVIEAAFGDLPVALVTSARAKRLYERLRATPAKAGAVVVMGRILWKYGQSESLFAGNPWRLVTVRGNRRQSGRLWSDAAIAAVTAAADAAGWHSVGTAVTLNHWLGQREGDVLAFARANWRDGRLAVTQSKTKAPVHLPIHIVPHLAARLDAELARQAAAGIAGTTLLLHDRTRQPWAEDAFRHTFAEVRQAAIAAARTAGAQDLAAELDGLQFMHLRHTAVTRLYEASCDVALICAITGHSPRNVEMIIERYCIATPRLAEAAFRKRMAAEEEQG